jgi:hypothetical protein
MPNKISKYQFFFDKSVVILSDTELVEKKAKEQEYERCNGRPTSPDTRQKNVSNMARSLSVLRHSWEVKSSSD